jgi:hypothetical protein
VKKIEAVELGEAGGLTGDRTRNLKDTATRIVSRNSAPPHQIGVRNVANVRDDKIPQRIFEFRILGVVSSDQENMLFTAKPSHAPAKFSPKLCLVEREITHKTSLQLGGSRAVCL